MSDRFGQSVGALALAGEDAVGGEMFAGDKLQHLPERIGEYEIVRPLGRGGMGSVFLARHTKLGREVAVKLLAGHRLADPRMRQRFEAEMRAIGRLSHPNIVAAHDARDVDGTAVLVTEYIDGLDLGQLVERHGPLAVADACEIIRQVAVALAYTSVQGFVHRDVKPSNIMLSRRGEVKLLDLGLARWQWDEVEQTGMTATGQAMGTADYVAPEQVTDSRSVDVRADIYSLGCTMFKLLSGTAPFAAAQHATAFAKMTAHVSTRPPSLAQHVPTAPAGLVKLVDAMLAKDPAKRPQTPQTIAEQLAAYCAGADLPQLAADAAAAEKSPAASPAVVSTAPHRTQPLRRRTVPLTVAIAAGLLGVLVGFAMGIVITITKPDGSKVTLTVPDGSDIDIRNQDDAGPATSAAQAMPLDFDQAAAATVQPRPVSPTPLALAIVIEPGDLSEERLAAAERALMEAIDQAPVTTDVGTWYVVAPEVDVPIVVTHQGTRYTLVRHDPAGMISWEETRQNLGMQMGGHQLGTQMTDHQSLQLIFSEALEPRVRALTSTNLQRRLAFILRDRVVIAPKIMNELRTSAQISGKFTREEIEYLRDSLNGLVNPPPATSPATFDIESEPAAPVVLPESEVQAAAQLQGVWRLVRVRFDGRTITDLPPTVMAFSEGTYYVCDPNFPVGGGAFSVSRDGQLQTIDMHDQMIRERNQPLTRSIYRLNADGRLEIHSNQAQPSQRPTGWALNAPSSPMSVSVLERLGDLPQSAEEARALAGDQDPKLAQALLTLVKALQTPPEKLAFPTLDQMAAVNMQKTSAANLKQIGIGFHKFHDELGKFPGSSNDSVGSPPDAAGKKIYPFSWRVALLPYLGEDELYQQYRFDEPWDSDHNKTLLAKMPSVYQGPLGDSVEQVRPIGETHYQGFVGPQTALGASFRTITDGTTPTLLVVESQAAVPWTQPQDLRFEKPEDAQRVKPFEGQPLSFLTADGAARSMDPVDYEKLAKLITRNGGEPVEP